jgi:hypothetical protein
LQSWVDEIIALTERKVAGASIFAAIRKTMSELITPNQIEGILQKLNRRYNCAMTMDDFKGKSFSNSSLSDLLIQRISDEVSGEWTTEKAFAQLKAGLVKMGFKADGIHMESSLEELFPEKGRRANISSWSGAAGMELDVLKPNGILNGALIFLFFTCIPIGIGMDWFVSIIGMAVCAAGIYILSKTASNFKMQTVGQLAEAVAWKLYLQQQKSGNSISQESIAAEVEAAIGKN